MTLATNIYIYIHIILFIFKFIKFLGRQLWYRAGRVRSRAQRAQQWQLGGVRTPDLLIPNPSLNHSHYCPSQGVDPSSKPFCWSHLSLLSFRESGILISLPFQIRAWRSQSSRQRRLISWFNLNVIWALFWFHAPMYSTLSPPVV